MLNHKNFEQLGSHMLYRTIWYDKLNPLSLRSDRGETSNVSNRDELASDPFRYYLRSWRPTSVPHKSIAWSRQEKSR